MVFRKGGKIAEYDRITYKGEELKHVNAFRYLGITLQPTIKSFKRHIRERTLAAIRSIYDIEDPTRLSLSSAMTLFNAKTLPAITYGTELIWTKLILSNLKNTESVKARYLKRVLGISKLSKYRLTYELAQETFLIEDLRIRLQLPSTRKKVEFLQSRRRKRAEISLEFYATDAMLDRRWLEPNNCVRSAMTRLAVHGFHLKLCT
ncbi:hypothetical protein ANN_17799 [Periplaneta americana]|uniref:Uncharacterized protein n=1 Tax=Periplaneta americana TaxID=6978 RepID=A0ABQ8STZ7_PERAM|nr:hypothetical protein ANN_17799 [Periplaneta americana]